MRRAGVRPLVLLATACIACAAAQGQGSSLPQPTLAEQLGLEGSLDNDTVRACNDEATRELARVDRARMPDALEGWRRALVASAPGDAECSDPRRAVGIELAVRRAIGSEHAAAFADRFEGLARAALDEAGNDDRALERVEHENPFTRSALIASLRRFDLFFERGARAAASAALERASLGAKALSDPRVDAAIATRRAALGTVAVIDDDTAALDRARSLVLEATIELRADASDDPAWHLAPGAAFGERTWIQMGESLVAVDERLKAQPVLMRDLLAPLDASWNLSFGETGMPWLQRPALEEARLALVLGRAKEKRGNALAVLDVSQSKPRPIWAHGENGFAHADGTRISEADVLLPGRLEFQPGPVCHRGLVIAQVLQWFQPGVSAGDQHVETAKTTAWLVAFDATTGRVEWKRRVASGADRRARTASRFAGERGLSCACLPLALQSGEVLVASELGIVARFDAADGSLHESWRMRRARPPADATPGFGGPIPIANQAGRLGSFALASADADGIAYLTGADLGKPASFRVDGLERLVAASTTGLTALVRMDGRLALQAIDTRAFPNGTGSKGSGLPQMNPAVTAASTNSGATSVSLPRGATWQCSIAGSSAILCAFDGRVALFDLRRDLAITSALDLAGLEAEADCGLLVHGARAYVVGTRRAWVLRLD